MPHAEVKLTTGHHASLHAKDALHDLITHAATTGLKALAGSPCLAMDSVGGDRLGR